MAFNDNAEHVRILTSVRKGSDGLRRRMQELQPELSTSASEAPQRDRPVGAPTGEL
jgi:hypothetical protein